jgi:hypothetical protein
MKIMPGVYNVGGTILQMWSFVDMEGSGESTTRITGTGGGPFSAVIGGAANSEIRSLTVENNGAVYNPSCACTQGTGIINYNAASNISNVSVIVSGATEGGNSGIRYINGGAQAKIRNTSVAVTNSRFSIGMSIQDGTSVVLKDVSISASCRPSGTGNSVVAIDNSRNSTIVADDLTIEAAGNSETWAVIGLQQSDSATARITNARINASGAAYALAVKNQGATVKINNSSLTGNYPLENYGTAYINGSELNGTIHQYSGTLRCLGVYDGNYNPVTCP